MSESSRMIGVVRPVRRWLAALGIATALVVATAVAPVSAQQGNDTESLELVAQSSWVDDGGIFNAQVRVAGAAPGWSVIVRVFPPWSERNAFLRNDYGEEPALLELEPIVLTDTQGASEIIPIEIEVVGPSVPSPPAEDPLDEAENPAVVAQLFTDGGSAVYPTAISLIDAEGTVQDTIVTSIVELPRDTRTAALQTAFILEAARPSAIDPDGNSTLTEANIADLKILVDAIAQHPNAAVALSINAETLLALERSALPDAEQVLTTLRDNLQPTQLVTTPFSDVEDQAWLDAGLESELVDLYDLGSIESVRAIGIQPETRVVMLDSTVTSDGLTHFAEQGVEGVIVHPEHLDDLDAEVFTQALTTSFLIPTTGNTALPALASDDDLAQHFTGDGEIAERANRLLADLTLLALTNAEVRQAVVVNPPDDWVPDATFLNVVLSGMERIPVITGATPIDALSNTAFTPSRGVGTISSPLRRSLDPRLDPTDLRSYRTEFSQASAAINSWSTVIASDTTSTQRLDELLLLSTNRSLTDVERRSYIDAVYTVINDQKTDSITAPLGETITLTGRRSQVPIIVDNNLEVDASAVLVLDSEKLSFPEGREIDVVLAPGSNRIDIPIDALASGDSPIRIQIFSPDRSVLLGSSEILVRVIVFSGVGLVIGVLAIIVIVIWWLRHWRQNRVTVDETLPAAASEESLGV